MGGELRRAGNDTIALDEPVVRSLLDEFPAGLILDAGCGTGRHTGYLAAAGHNVVGVDASEQMLRRARSQLPQVAFEQGELTALPLPDGAVSAAVCALTLSHLPDLAPSVGELARALRPGGRLVISNPHPFATGILNWRAVTQPRMESGGRSLSTRTSMGTTSVPLARPDFVFAA